MDCREFRELLGDETDGRLAPADAARLDAHVALCASCAEERRELASLRAAFRAMPRPAVPQGFRTQVMDRLPRGRVLRFPRALGWIAAVAAVAVVAVTLWNRSGPGAERDVASASRIAEKRAPEPAKDLEVQLSERSQEDREASAKSRDDVPHARKKQATADAKTPAGEKAASERGDAPAQPPAAPVPPMDARTAAEDKPPPEPAREELARHRADAEQVLYVVFRDETAALKFAASLAPPAEAEKAKAETAATAATPTAPAPAPAAKAAPKPAETKSDTVRDEVDRSVADVVEEASFTERRVVARATVAAPMSDADFDKALAAAGGRAVPVGDAEKFRELLDAEDDATKRSAGTLGGRAPSETPPPAPAPAPAPGLTSPGGGATAEGAKEGPSTGSGGVGGGAGGFAAGGDAGETRRNAKARRVVVVVVLGKPPAAAPNAK